MSEPTTDPAETEAKDKTPEVEPIPTFASESAVPSPKPTYMVVENTFYAQTPNGELKMPLFFQTKKIRLMPDGLTLLEQVYYLEGAESPLVAALDELDMIDSREFADKLFDAYQEKQKARLGEIAALLDLIEEHRAAVAFDLRSRLGIGLDEVGGRITFGEAIDHVETLIDTPGSHIHAAVNDWLWPATETDLAIILHAEWYMNVHRAKGVREIILPRPWSGTQKSADVTDEERANLRAQLIATSPSSTDFGGMMTSEVGSGQIAFLPTFKGFRSTTLKEVDGATDAAGRSFKTGFGRAATSTGTSAGRSFKDSFSSASSGLVKSATDEVAKASRELSAVRLKEADITGRVRLGESQLAEARSKYADGSSQVIRAEERLATASRQLITAQDSVKASTDRLSTAKRTLANTSVDAATSSAGFSGILSRIPQFFNSAGSQSAKSFGSGFSGGIGGIAAGSFLGISAAGLARSFGELISTGISAAIDSVGGASDLFETTSAVSQVYGDAADEIKSFASTANKSLGQTRLQALKGAQTFGVFAKQAGLTGKPLANFSTGLVSLAGDLASFYNSSPDEAIDAIGAGLRGEAEPLRRFGVLLDDATLRQKALELGIYDGSDALTGQQRILAAQAVIMDQTTIAQGDFARTSDGLANQQRILAATLEDTKTKFGEALLPAFSGAATFANDTLLPKLDAVIDRVGPKLGQALEDAGPQFEELWKKAEPLIDGFADYAATDGIKSLIDVMNEAADAAPGWAAFTDFLFDPNAQPAAGLNAVSDWVDTAGASLHDFFAGSGREERLKWQDDFFAGFAADASTSGQTFGYTFGDAYTFGLGESKPAAVGAGASLAAAANEAALAGVPTFSGTGGQLGSGFAAGILGSKQEVVDATRLVGDAAVEALRIALDSHSPSRKTEKLGSYAGQGFTRGVIGEYGQATRAMAGLVQIGNFSSSGMSLSASGQGGAAASGPIRDVSVPVTVYAGEEDGRVLGRKLGREIATQLTER